MGVEISTDAINFKRYERTILYNNWGYYFDFLLSKSDYKEYVVSLDKLKVDSCYPQIILYPTIEDLIKYHDKIINSNCTIILYETEKYYYTQKTAPVNNYFKKTYLTFDSDFFFQYINLPNLSEFELRSKLENDYYRFLYCILNLRNAFDLNLSLLNGVTEKNYRSIFSKYDFFYTSLAAAKVFYTIKYARESSMNFDIDVLTKIAVCELKNKYTPEVRLIIKLLDHNNELESVKRDDSIFVSEKDKELLDNWDNTIDKLKKEAIIYEPTKGIIKLIL